MSTTSTQPNPRLPPRDFIAAEKFHIFDAAARGHARRLFIFFRQSGSSAGLPESARPYSCLFVAAAPTTEANNELAPQFHGDGASNIARFDEDGYSLLLQFVPDQFPDRVAVKNYTTKHRMTGVCEAFAILGFIRFLHDFHLFVATHAEETALIGTHPVYGVKTTKLILLNEDGRNQETMVRMSNRIEDLWSEEYKLKDAFLGVRPTAFCYCNSGLDLSRTIQSSCLSNAENPRKKYQWNNLYCARYETALPILKEHRVFTRLIFGDVIQRRILVSSPSSGYTNVTSYKNNSNIPPRYSGNNSGVEVTTPRGGNSSSLLDRTSSNVVVNPFIGGEQRGGGGTTVAASYQFSIITRRSRHFAGVRYLKRGITEEGRAANHVETEQVLIDENTDMNNPAVNSCCQVRCSVPVLWYHEQVGAPKPPIYFGANDANFTSTRNHFAELIEDFGTPILVYNLMQQNEKKRREEGLSDLYFKAVTTITAPFHNRKISKGKKNHNNNKESISNNNNSNSNNDLLDHQRSVNSAYSSSKTNSNSLKYIKEVPPIIYQEYDFKKNVRTAWNVITGFAERSLSMTGTFTLRSGVVTSMQRGVIRTNCVDCIDRTNVGQCFFATHIVEHQLMALSATTQPVSNVTTVRLRSMMLDMFQVLGDNIAQDYCGSETVSAGIDTGRGILWDKAMGVKRFYANKFSDDERQMSINYFLGLYNMKYRRAVTLTKCVCGRSVTGDGEDGNPTDDVLRVGVDAYHDDPTAMAHDATYYASKWKSSATNVAPIAGVRSLIPNNNNTNTSKNNINSNDNNNNNIHQQKVHKTTFCLACAPKQLQRVEDDTPFFTSVKNFFSKASNEEYEANRNKSITCDALVRPTKLEDLNEIDYYLHIRRFRKPPTVREMEIPNHDDNDDDSKKKTKTKKFNNNIIKNDNIAAKETSSSTDNDDDEEQQELQQDDDDDDDEIIVDGIPKFWWELPLKRFELTNPYVVNTKNQNSYIGAKAAAAANRSASNSNSRCQSTIVNAAAASREPSRSGAVSMSASTSDLNLAANNNNNNNDESSTPTTTSTVDNTSLNINFNNNNKIIHNNNNLTNDDGATSNSDMARVDPIVPLDISEQQKRMRIIYSRSSAAWSARFYQLAEVHIDASDVILLSKSLDRFEQRLHSIFSLDKHNNNHRLENSASKEDSALVDAVNESPSIFRVLPDEQRDLHVHAAPFFAALTSIKADECLLMTDPRRYLAELYASSPAMQQELYWYGYDYYNLDYAVRTNNNSNNSSNNNTNNFGSSLPSITPSTSAATIAYQLQLQELQQYFLLQQQEKRNQNQSSNSQQQQQHDVFHEWDTHHDDACYYLASVSALGPVNEINCRKMLTMFNEWELYTEKHLCSAISTNERRKMTSMIRQNMISSNNNIIIGNNNSSNNNNNNNNNTISSASSSSSLLPISSSVPKNVGVLSPKAINTIVDLCSTLKPTKFVIDHLAAINIYGGLLHYNNLHYTQTNSAPMNSSSSSTNNNNGENQQQQQQRISILPSTQPLFVSAFHHSHSHSHHHHHNAQFLSSQSGLVQSIMMLRDTEKLALKKWALLVQQIKPPMSEHQAEAAIRDTLTRSWGTTQDFFDELISDSSSVLSNAGDASYRRALQCYDQFLHFGSGSNKKSSSTMTIIRKSPLGGNNNNNMFSPTKPHHHHDPSLHRQFTYHRLLNSYRQHPGYHRSLTSRYLAMHGLLHHHHQQQHNNNNNHFIKNASGGEIDDLAPTVTKHGSLLVGSKGKDIHIHVAPELLWDDPTMLRSHPLCFFMHRTPPSRAEFFNTLHHWVALAAAPESEGGVPRFHRTRYDNDLTAKKAQKLPRGVILVCVFSLDELADWMVETYFKHHQRENSDTSCCFTFRKGFPKRSIFIPLLNEVADAARLDPCLLRRQPMPLIAKAARELAALWVQYGLAVPVYGDEATKHPVPTVKLVNDPQQLYTLECFDEAIHRQDVASRAFRRLYRLQQYYQENQIAIPLLDVFFSSTTPFANDAESVLEEFEQLRANAMTRMTMKRHARMMKLSGRQSSDPSASPSNNNSGSSKRKGNNNSNNYNHLGLLVSQNKDSSSSSSSDDDIDEKYILSKHVDAAEEEEDQAFGGSNNNYNDFTNSLLEDPDDDANNDSIMLADASDIALTIANSSSPNKLPIAGLAASGGGGTTSSAPSSPASKKLLQHVTNRNDMNNNNNTPQLALRNKRIADVRYFAESQSHVSCTMWSHTAARKYLLNQTESKIDDLSRLATVSLEYLDPVARCVVLVNTFNAIYAMVSTRMLSLNPSMLGGDSDPHHPQEQVFSMKSWAAGRLLRRFGFSFGGVYFTLSDIKHGLLRGNRPPPGQILPPFGLDDDDLGNNDNSDTALDLNDDDDVDNGDEHHIRGDRGGFKPPGSKASRSVESRDALASREAWLRRKKRMLVPTSVVRQDPRWVLLLADILVENAAIDLEDAEATAASIAAATSGQQYRDSSNNNNQHQSPSSKKNNNNNDQDDDDGDDFAPVISTGEHLTSLTGGAGKNGKNKKGANNNTNNQNKKSTNNKSAGLSFAAILKNIWASASHSGNPPSNNNNNNNASSPSPGQPRKRMVGFNNNDNGEDDENTNTYGEGDESETNNNNNRRGNKFIVDEEDYDSAMTCVAVDVDAAEKLLRTQTEKIYRLLSRNFYSSKIDPNQSGMMNMNSNTPGAAAEGHTNLMNYYGSSNHHHHPHHHHDSSTGNNNAMNTTTNNNDANNTNFNHIQFIGGGGIPSPQAATVMAHLVSMPEFTGVDPDSAHRYRLNTAELQRNVMRTLEDLISHYGQN